ncbi:Uncharacterized protein BCB44BAC_02677 [Bacillus cytotoxicus]|uniref:Transposase n=1 Tax=Bacillus cytotoxicus TaxID=580165 RepID=A0AAX2CIM5_9BACI|nr:Uncharacterized protein BCB44BAC_02677 [Bacillus cytotoxicus]
MEKQNLFKWNKIIVSLKKPVRSMLGFKSYETANSILSGIEVMHMRKKGQLHQRVKSVQNEVKFIHKLFGVAS